jgi:alpha-1,6-mannosyltransferase
MTKVKICDIVQSYSPRSGGVKFYLTAKMRCLAERDDVRHLAVVPSHRTVCRREYDSTVYEVRSPSLPGSVDYRLLMNKRRILAIIEAERPDVIEVDGAYLSAWIGLSAGARFGIPVVGFYHSDFPRKLSDKARSLLPDGVCDLLAASIDGYLRRLYNRMAATVVALHKYETILGQIGIRNVVRIPLGVETDIFYPRDSRASILDRFDLPPETVLFFYAGRLAEMKNIDILLSMMARLSDDHPPCRLIIAGDGELRDEVSAATDASPDITWLPYIQDRNELARFYSAADLFVHAGVMETFGLVSVEAQACGTRVLGVRGGGLEKTLEGEDPLIMAEDASAEALADAVERIRAMDEGEAERMARSRRVRERFSWERTFLGMVGLYETLKL